MQPAEADTKPVIEETETLLDFLHDQLLEMILYPETLNDKNQPA